MENNEIGWFLKIKKFHIFVNINKNCIFQLFEVETFEDTRVRNVQDIKDHL
jgi:hypothetical protein